jgi:CDGSH-type Zn-finger protein/truncated hemoglobin YjbI
VTDQDSISMISDASADGSDPVGAALDSAVSCWWASVSLRSSTVEGGLTDVQATAVRNWKAQLLSASMHYLIKAAALSADSNTVNVSHLFPRPFPGPAFSPELIRRLRLAATESDHEAVPPAGGLALLMPAETGATPASVEEEYRAAMSGDAGFDPIRPAVPPGATGTLSGSPAAVGALATDGWRLLQVLLARLARAEKDADGTTDLVWTVRRLFDSVLRPLGETLSRLPAAPDRLSPGTQPGHPVADNLPPGTQPGHPVADNLPPGTQPGHPATDNPALDSEGRPVVMDGLSPDPQAGSVVTDRPSPGAETTPVAADQPGIGPAAGPAAADRLSPGPQVSPAAADGPSPRPRPETTVADRPSPGAATVPGGADDAGADADLAVSCAVPVDADTDRPVRNNGSGEHHDAGAPVDETVWRLAREATVLRPSPGEPAEMLEAVAALQDLACRLAPAEGPGNRLERIAELRRLQSAAPAGIEPAPDGPYLVTNVGDIEDWLGVTVSTPPQVAFCRCGASGTKPYCDGAHARTGFTGEKSPKRIPDQRDTYRGLQATIFDNRGTCAHSGFCTDRLSSVFRLREEPFVLPSGGRFDEIAQAVRACPSGALSLAIGDNEIRDVVDQDRKPSIEISKDGPYRVTGGIALTDRQGEDHPRNTGASHEHYSLCRCGQSQNKPFCSGMHWYVDFHDPVPPADHEPTIFEWAGGLPAFRRMTNLFYSKYAPQDPELSRLFADMNPGHPEHVAAWLSEVFGGPPNYTERHGGYTHMISEHVGKRLTEKQRSRWAALMSQAADEAGLPTDPEFRAAFIAYIEWGTRIAVENSQQDARPPAGMTVPRWWWVCDATPAARISALAPVVVEEEVELPGDDVELSFERHIRQLFRAQDRNSMKFVFDLWAVADVQQHADAILHRLANGSMPCDGAWPPEKVAVFSRWIEAGRPA